MTTLVERLHFEATENNTPIQGQSDKEWRSRPN